MCTGPASVALARQRPFVVCPAASFDLLRRANPGALLVPLRRPDVELSGQVVHQHVRVNLAIGATRLSLESGGSNTLSRQLKGTRRRARSLDKGSSVQGNGLKRGRELVPQGLPWVANTVHLGALVSRLSICSVPVELMFEAGKPKLGWLSALAIVIINCSRTCSPTLKSFIRPKSRS
jgi:hypothetical protein